MRGEVEIWDGDKLLHKESNLLVNGAAELLADIMTVSPSLSGITDHATSSILDSSNYTIQAISFGKDASAYQTNAHALNSRRNIAAFSTPSAVGNGIYHTNLEVCSTPDISPPPQFAGIASSVAHVIRLDETSTSTNGYITVYHTAQSVSSKGAKWAVSGGQDNWWCHSCYMKFPATASSVSEPSETTSRHHPRSHFSLSIYGEGRDLSIAAGRGNLGHSRLGTVVDWNDTDKVIPYSPSSIALSYYDAARYSTARGEASGYSINNWQQNGGVVPVGDGWYRVWTAGLAPVSGVSGTQTALYPITYEVLPTGETTGSMYTYGWQMEMGRWPTELQFNTQGFEVDNWDLSGSVLNRDHSPGTITDNGTVRVVPPFGTSSYVPTNYLSSPPNPESTRVEDGDTALLDVSSDTLRNFNMGQNLNVIPYRKNPGGAFGLGPVDSSQKLVPNNVVDGDNLITLITNYVGAGNYGGLSGYDSFGPQAYYLGCYPEGSSTGGSNWALVSSLDNSAAYSQVVNGTDPNFVSGTYNSIVNEASSMDVSGFVNMVMSGSPGTTTEYAMSSTSSGLCVSGGIDITNSGTVEYSILLGSGDVGYSNLYGGIYNMGLWTIDLDETLKAGNTPPYSFGPLNNPRKYKLFATKHLTKNLGFIEDNGANAGALNYSDLTIKWRLHFI